MQKKWTMFMPHYNRPFLSENNYPSEVEYNKCKSLMNVYGITAVQSRAACVFIRGTKRHSCRFCLQFHLPIQEGNGECIFLFKQGD